MARYQERQSYTDWLTPDEEIPAHVRDVCEELERQGWTCVNFTSRGFRFLCPVIDAGCKHSGLWISATFIPAEFLAHAEQRTCFRGMPN